MSQLLRNPLFSKKSKSLNDSKILVNPNFKNRRNASEGVTEVNPAKKKCIKCHSSFLPEKMESSSKILWNQSIRSSKHCEDEAKEMNNGNVEPPIIVIDDNMCVKKKKAVQNSTKDVPIICLSDEETETVAKTNGECGKIRPQKITLKERDYIPLVSNPREEITSEKPRKEKRKKKFESTKNISPESAGMKICHSSHDDDEKRLEKPLREIIVDGINLGMIYTKNRYFSEEGIIIVVDFFIARGHVVKVFVPQSYRSRSRPVLEKMYEDGIVIFTPSRKVGGERITSDDQNYILEYAIQSKGVIISLDPYRYLYETRPEFQETIATKVLPPTFVGNMVMFPPDPLGRMGPTLTEFLSH